MDGVIEIITGRERRRRWSTEEKRRIVMESMERGAVMRAVAARNGICESLLYAWRRQMRDGTLRESETPGSFRFGYSMHRWIRCRQRPTCNGHHPLARRRGQI